MLGIIETNQPILVFITFPLYTEIDKTIRKLKNEKITLLQVSYTATAAFTLSERSYQRRAESYDSQVNHADRRHQSRSRHQHCWTDHSNYLTS